VSLLVCYRRIDLPANNRFVALIDDADKRVLAKHLNNDLSLTVEAFLHWSSVRSVANR